MQPSRRVFQLLLDGTVLMNQLNRLLAKLLRDECGQDLIEYALVAALIGLGATAAMRALATTIGSALTGIGSRLTANV